MIRHGRAARSETIWPRTGSVRARRAAAAIPDEKQPAARTTCSAANFSDCDSAPTQREPSITRFRTSIFARISAPRFFAACSAAEVSTRGSTEYSSGSHAAANADFDSDGSIAVASVDDTACVVRPSARCEATVRSRSASAESPKKSLERSIAPEIGILA